ncbi:MAG: hypothetical protein AAGD38_19210, partial [Acidobacteriota bacterium]
MACQPADQTTTPVEEEYEVTTTTACEPSTGEVDFGCSAPPNTFQTSSLSGTDLGTAFDSWAWSTFAALNWPALESTDSTTYPTGFVRGVPDTTQTFTGATSTDVAVWETFKEKRELFNDLATSDAWQDFTFDTTYSPTFAGGNVEACADIDETLHARVQAQPRVMAQLSKQTFNTADETAEVASPAQESTNTLCAGFSGSTLDSCQKILFPPPENGSKNDTYTASEDNSRNPVGPRVFKGDPATENFIYYEVKLNYDYYRYVADNGLNDYDTAVEQAQAQKIQLPIRTNAQAAPGPNSQALANYDAATVATCYANQLDNCDSSLSNFGSGIDASNLPQVGAMQLKAAWLPTSLLDGSTSDYHTTTAIYYKTSESQPEGLCYDVQDFGLLALHIIQRIHGGTSADEKGETIGGTYIFATWEHESIADGDGYTYVQYFAEAGTEQDDPQPYPNTSDGIQVARLTHEVDTGSGSESVT